MWIVAMECVTEFMVCLFFFFQAEDGIRDRTVTGVQTCALPIFAFRQKGYYNEALREYRLALERGEDRRLTLQAMAELHLLKRDFPAALELYDTLLREVPDSPKLWNERGVVLHQSGRTEDALSSYRQAVPVDPTYALARHNLRV